MGAESDKNSATKWADPASKKDPAKLGQSQSAPEIPVDVSTPPQPSPEEEAMRKEQEATAAHAAFLQQQTEEENKYWHGEGDQTSVSAEQQWRAGKISSHELYLQTGRLRSRVSDKDNSRSAQIKSPNIFLNTPGLDEWHRMNPDKNGADYHGGEFYQKPSQPNVSTLNLPRRQFGSIISDSSLSKISTPVVAPKWKTTEVVAGADGTVTKKIIGPIGTMTVKTRRGNG